MWPACTPIPVTHAKSGLAKGLQAAGSVDVGELANTEGRKKDRTSLLPSSLSRRPLQNLTALIAGGSLPAFFHFLFQDVLLARLFHKKVNLYSASASFLINPLHHPALQATPFLVTCGLQQVGGAAQVMLGWA